MGDNEPSRRRSRGQWAKRTRLMVEVVRAVRQAVSPGFPFRPGCRPGEQQNYDASLARTPDELEEVITPLAGAGVDNLHISQRWFWMPAFDQGLNT
jgi:2,4-dienoyl-CoA reductase-like NADH-dependent reductase (Old Yellow Enzyme family)